MPPRCFRRTLYPLGKDFAPGPCATVFYLVERKVHGSWYALGVLAEQIKTKQWHAYVYLFANDGNPTHILIAVLLNLHSHLSRWAKQVLLAYFVNKGSKLRNEGSTGIEKNPGFRNLLAWFWVLAPALSFYINFQQSGLYQ